MTIRTLGGMHGVPPCFTDPGSRRPPASAIQAIKTIKPNTGRTLGATEELYKEAALMAQVTAHENLVSLIGVVTIGEPMMLLVSFCEDGSLLEVIFFLPHPLCVHL